MKQIHLNELHFLVGGMGYRGTNVMRPNYTPKSHIHLRSAHETWKFAQRKMSSAADSAIQLIAASGRSLCEINAVIEAECSMYKTEPRAQRGKVMLALTTFIPHKGKGYMTHRKEKLAYTQHSLHRSTDVSDRASRIHIRIPPEVKDL